MKKQTAVEFLAEQLDNIIELYPSQFENVNKVIEQAKQMEKEQILNAYNFGYWESEDSTKIADMYYNETFGKRHNDVIQ
jgi:hypothetical protein